jgi:DNA-binding NtrC family response regulator
MLYASLLALHRDVREILRVLKEGGVRSAAEADAFEGLREVHPDQPARTPPSLSLDHIERTAIREALNRSGGNRRRAADALGISERTLYRKIKEYGLG